MSEANLDAEKCNNRKCCFGRAGNHVIIGIIPHLTALWIEKF